MNKYAHLENYVSELRKTAADKIDLSQVDFTTALRGNDYADYVTYYNKATQHHKAGMRSLIPLVGLGMLSVVPPLLPVTIVPLIGTAGYGLYQSKKAEENKKKYLALDPAYQQWCIDNPGSDDIRNFAASKLTPTSLKMRLLNSKKDILNGNCKVI